MVPLVVFLGAGIGGGARYVLGGWIQSASGAGFPWGTLIINVSGSLVLAFLYTLLEATAAPVEWRAFLGIGICGGYTTFSTFSYETVRLLLEGNWIASTGYVAASMLLSIAGALLGYGLANAALGRG